MYSDEVLRHLRERMEEAEDPTIPEDLKRSLKMLVTASELGASLYNDLAWDDNPYADDLYDILDPLFTGAIGVVAWTWEEFSGAVDPAPETE